MSDEPKQPDNRVNAAEYTVRLLESMNKRAGEQNALLKAFVENQTNHARSLQVWKEANPELSQRYGEGAKLADTMLKKFLDEMLDDMDEKFEDSEDFGSFTAMEFIDKFAPRICQMQNVVQLLTNLGTVQ